MNSLVSIITPTYNHEKFIAECIESVLAQTYPHWEMIIIDDASTDKTPYIIEEYAKKDERIKFIRHQKNWGIYKLADTYNQALYMSRGENIAILEGDDFWPSDRLEKQLNNFDYSKTILCWGKVALCNEKGEILGVIPTKRYKVDILKNTPKGKILEVLLYKSIIPPVGVMIKKEILISIGGFQNREYLPFVDYPTFLRLSLEGEFSFVDDIMGYWRRHEFQSTAKLGEKQEEASGKFVIEFFASIPEDIKKALGTKIKKVVKNQTYRLAYPYFSLGRINIAQRKWEDARKNFKIAFKKGSFSIKIKSMIGILMTILKFNFEKLLVAKMRKSFSKKEE